MIKNQLYSDESFVPNSEVSFATSISEVQNSIDKLKNYKDPHLPAELIKYGNKMLKCKLHNHILLTLS